ncbi:glucose/galactose MFS transporter [Chromobacterium sp. ATCC 53434]|uniref:sugar MFS transporter n=1 Tax=Chromobacterium TaxID=535 RepID=UPI000C78E877|nr:sugar MFS transporter [Chromobacterium sp. ATCC 53434]AUH53379.1 glucose/galactose MFS transporter [Chromobacterium sp. ATCC 53434]
MISAPATRRVLAQTIVLVSCTFFLWGLSYGLLDVLNKHFQEAMHISKAGSGLLQIAYFLAYFVIAIPAAAFNERYGYKAGLIAGLALFATGSLLFIPSLSAGSFPFFVLALFILACGSGCLETTANPYISLLGDEDGAERRLNLAQAFCGLGTVIGPLIGGAFFFGLGAQTGPQGGHGLVMQVYVWIAAFVALLAALIARTPMPEAESSSDERPRGTWRALLGQRRFSAGVLAQFLYVAAQVGVGAFFINYATESRAGLSSQSAAWLLSMAMMLFMVGRFVGTFVIRYLAPSRLLAVCALANIALSLVVVLARGDAAIAALMLIFFFMSIMFPTIFSLAIKGLYGQTKMASSLLAMSVSGGAVFPYAMGLVADHYGTATAYALPLLSFVVIFAYGMRLDRKPSPAPARKALEY